MSSAALRAHQAKMLQIARYSPVMKFAPAYPDRVAVYLAFRWSHRGMGGWLTLSTGPLATLLQKYLPHLGKQSFYELF